MKIKALRELVDSIPEYPQGVIGIRKPIPGTAFFPGGSGLWQEAAANAPDVLPVGGVMILGHNFDSSAGYERSLAKGKENMKSATWAPLIKLLTQARVDLRQCFFTNFFMGLIAEGSAVGKFPGAKDPAFVELCRTILTEQIRAQRPSMILVLGVHVPPLIAPMSIDLAPWSHFNSFKDIDVKDQAVTFPVHFEKADHRCAVILLTHPCNRHLNIGRRGYPGVTGNELEIGLIREARRIANGSRAELLDPLTDEQLTRKAKEGTLTFDETVAYLIRMRGMLRKDAIDHASGPPMKARPGVVHLY